MINSREVFGVNYSAFAEVRALAEKFGVGFVIFKHPERPNYNITHVERTDRYDPSWVVYRT